MEKSKQRPKLLLKVAICQVMALQVQYQGFDVGWWDGWLVGRLVSSLVWFHLVSYGFHVVSYGFYLVSYEFHGAFFSSFSIGFWGEFHFDVVFRLSTVYVL